MVKKDNDSHKKGEKTLTNLVYIYKRSFNGREGEERQEGGIIERILFKIVLSGKFLIFNTLFLSQPGTLA